MNIRIGKWWTLKIGWVSKHLKDLYGKVNTREKVWKMMKETVRKTSNWRI